MSRARQKTKKNRHRPFRGTPRETAPVSEMAAPLRAPLGSGIPWPRYPFQNRRPIVSIQSPEARQGLAAAQVARHRSPEITFSVRAWTKLKWFLHRGNTEVAGFGLGRPEDPLYITEFLPVPQRASGGYVEMDESGIADYIDVQVDRRLEAGIEEPSLDSIQRVWIHTHPGSSARPSGQDEATIHGPGFNTGNWAVMFIMSRTGETYCRLVMNVAPYVAVLLPVKVDYAGFVESDLAGMAEEMRGWEDEYTRCVNPPSLVPARGTFPNRSLRQEIVPVDGRYRQGRFAPQEDPFGDDPFASSRYAGWDRQGIEGTPASEPETEDCERDE